MSSASVVARVKRQLKAHKVGHAGTLDPDATGLLICLLNGATRVASYALDGTKVYSGVMRLGVRTSTDDMTGEVLAESNRIPEFNMIKEAAASFLGRIQQVPPKVSAKKIDGQRAYALERKGQEVVLESREVRIEHFEISPIDYSSISYTVACSPGTYVRALARDLGELLGCGGAAQSIRREASGRFNVRDGVALEGVSWGAALDWSILLPDVPVVAVPERIAADLVQGRVRALKEVREFFQPEEQESQLVIFVRQGFEDQSLGLLRLLSDGSLGFEATIARQDCHREW